MSQSGLARAANLSNDYIYRIERNKVKNVGIETFGRIAKALGVDPAELQYGPFVAELRKASRQGATLVPPPQAHMVPLLTGTISAGDFTQNFTTWTGETVEYYGRNPKEIVAWEVDGNSMAPRIHDGDIVFVRLHAEPKDGDAVLANKNGQESTVKIFKKLKDGSTELRPCNPSYPTLRIADDDEVTVIGVVDSVWGKWRRE